MVADSEIVLHPDAKSALALQNFCSYRDMLVDIAFRSLEQDAIAI